MIVSNPIKSSVRINRSQFEQIFIISYVEKKLDQVQKLIEEQTLVSIKLSKISSIIAQRSQGWSMNKILYWG